MVNVLVNQCVKKTKEKIETTMNVLISGGDQNKQQARYL